MLPEPDFELLRTFDTGAGTLVALIGGGGKTTLMNRLAVAASAAGHRVLVTTTTRIRAQHQLPLVLAACFETAITLLPEAWELSRIVTLAASTADSGKLKGVDPDTLCRLSHHFPQALMVCEADGSAGRPLKVHAEHEPVIPACSTHVAIVGGLDAVGQPVDGKSIHRIELLESTLSRLKTITPSLAARVLSNAAATVQGGCAPVYVLNKADTPERRLVSAQIKEHLLQLRPGARVIVTDRGAVVESENVDVGLNSDIHV